MDCVWTYSGICTHAYVCVYAYMHIYIGNELRRNKP